MTEPSEDRPRVSGEEMPAADERHRDPGADLEAEGVPDVADDSTTGKGEVPEPEEPVAPAEMPTVRTAREMSARPENPPRGVEEHWAAERPEPDSRSAEATPEDYLDVDRPEPDTQVAGAEDEGKPAEEAAVRLEEEPEEE
ncbi:hypothetical protein [Phytoactinopolyspora halotolerans]|uniref:DUF5709 domain-containing protein n=1 Tax=Phytoactinopolyspora halotolerans TaxID=1981512 RepID=A0A6L9SDX2_9ACTN|nr:hypothetical protein [Phytoactinopolyspora halotolerans]NEE02260.1 hypothetical protein [Phytoactinopolyspora halotolerans]